MFNKSKWCLIKVDLDPPFVFSCLQKSVNLYWYIRKHDLGWLLHTLVYSIYKLFSKVCAGVYMGAYLISWGIMFRSVTFGKVWNFDIGGNETFRRNAGTCKPLERLVSSTPFWVQQSCRTPPAQHASLRLRLTSCTPLWQSWQHLVWRLQCIIF